MGLGCTRKQAEQAVGRKPVRGALPFCFGLEVPTLSSCLDFLHDALWYGSISMGNPFLLESGFDECFITTVKSSRAPSPVTWDPFALGI